MSLTTGKFPSEIPLSYEVVRPKIRSGDLLLCSGNGIVSSLVRVATESVWSHVAVLIRVDSVNRIMVHESVETNGVQTVPLSQYVRNYQGSRRGFNGGLVIARHMEIAQVPKKELKRIARTSFRLKGNPYDVAEIARIVGRIGKSKLGITRNEVVRDRDYICSEYAWEFFHAAGVSVPYDERGFIAPKDFARADRVKLLAVVASENPGRLG